MVIIMMTDQVPTILATYKEKVENTEVGKPKYESEKKSHLSVSTALLTHDYTL